MRRKVKLELVIDYDLNHSTKAGELYQQVADAADHLAIDGLLTGSLPVELKGYSVEVSRWEDDRPTRATILNVLTVVGLAVSIIASVIVVWIYLERHSYL